MRSAQFDDIYFSVEDGLAETRHTFLGGNGLPGTWEGCARFCICETGFGTGLNMLAAWRLFEETAKADQRLDLISIEKFPLSKDDIRAALGAWDLQPQLDRMLDQYPLRVPGFHRLNLSPRVTLTLAFGDVKDVLPQLDAQVDAWFLDGFAPAKNPEMWTADLYAQMARLSHAGTSVATFTAAGAVRRGLMAAGFAVEKRPGYGRKRDMTAGKFTSGARVSRTRPRHVAIVGAGLSGLSAAWHLKREGVDVTVYEAGDIATGASGNSTGIINPKLTAQPSAQSAYYTFAYDYALRTIKALGAEFSGHGSLHLQMNDDKARRFAGYQTLGWHADHMRFVDSKESSDIAGVTIDTSCLFYPDAASASPRLLCAALAKDVTVKTHCKIDDLKTLEADAIVLANASSVTQFCDLPVGSVRGQVSRVQPNGVSAKVKTNLCYGGYFTPALRDGAHVCGATFQPWDEDASVRDADHDRNLTHLMEAVPALAGLQASDGWIGFRAAAKDRFPIVGAVADLYVSVAHGSHGLISALAGGAVLAAAIAGGPTPLPMDAITALKPARFEG